MATRRLSDRSEGMLVAALVQGPALQRGHFSKCLRNFGSQYPTIVVSDIIADDRRPQAVIVYEYWDRGVTDAYSDFNDQLKSAARSSGKEDASFNGVILSVRTIAPHDLAR